RGGLVEVVDGWTRAFTFLLGRTAFKPRNREQALDDNPLRHDGLELVVHEIDACRGARGEILDGRIRNIDRVGKRHLLKDTYSFITDVKPATSEEVASLAADQAEGNVASGCFVEDELSGRFDDVGIEAAAQAAIRCNDNQQRPPRALRRNAKQWMGVLI